MKYKLKEFRNQKGKLLFKATQIHGDWYVLVKNHGRYTLVRLQSDGSLAVKDYDEEV